MRAFFGITFVVIGLAGVLVFGLFKILAYDEALQRPAGEAWIASAHLRHLRLLLMQ